MRMRDNRVESDVCTYTIRIKSFCKTRRPHAALRLLCNMPYPNAVVKCYNSSPTTLSREGIRKVWSVNVEDV
ncbi:Tetratricopeptide-like helical domain superfamily [Sesbania bispinosa]|nr:Tetratricopeptide-like helical domain superfamily [Sesbania bispinosa]